MKSLAVARADIGGSVPLVFSGKPCFITKMQKFIADTFIGSRNYSACARGASGRYGLNVTVARVKRVLDFPVVRAYISERLLDLGYSNTYTRERWVRELVEYKDGIRPAGKDAKEYMKLLGQSFGEGGGVNQTVLIQLNQGDGSP